MSDEQTAEHERQLLRAAEVIQMLYAALAPWAQAAKELESPDFAERGEPFDDPEEVLWAGRTGFLRVRDFRRALEVVRWMDEEIQAAAQEYTQ